MITANRGENRTCLAKFKRTRARVSRHSRGMGRKKEKGDREAGRETSVINL